jgi:MoaA/NifB/PqqE/SkfB family radical SAM enzyme
MIPEDIVELVIEASSYCNSRCPHCPRFNELGHVHPNLVLGNLSPAQLKGLDLKKLPNLKTVTFEGDKGDPIMNPHLLDLIALFPKHVKIRISTNGGIRGRTWWTKLALIPNLVVNFSIDGLASTNNLYRVNVDYNKVINNAIAFIQAGGNANWRCLIFQHNQHEIFEIKQLSRELGFNSVIFRIPHIDRFQGQPVWPVKIDGKYSHDLIPTTLAESEIKKHSQLYKYIPTPFGFSHLVNNSRCIWARSNKLYINFQSHVLPCCMMHFETLNDYPGKLLFSNLVGNFNNISLEHSSLDDIMLLYADKLESSLASYDTMLPVCKKICFSYYESTTR